MLLNYGIAHLDETWHVDEAKAPGYSRIYYLTKGSLQYFSNETELLLIPEHLYILPSIRDYRMSLGEPEEKICTYLHMDLSPIIIEKLIDFDLKSNPLVASYVSTLYQSIEQTKKDMLFHLVECLPVVLEDFADLKKVSKEMNNVLAYITTNLSDKIDLDQLAHIAGYNTNYFIKIFNDTFGISPHQYMIRKRLAWSLQLILAGRSITEAAETVGFSDSSSFSRAFKNHYMVKPSQFCDKYFIMP